MRKDLYQYNFKKADGTIVSETNLMAGPLRAKIIALFKEYYDFNYNATQSAIYDLASRAHKVNKFVREHIQVQRVVTPTVMEQPAVMEQPIIN